MLVCVAAAAFCFDCGAHERQWRHFIHLQRARHDSHKIAFNKRTRKEEK